MGALPKPEVPGGAAGFLFDRLHELHHRAGWPSLRDMAREVGCSHTTISAAFSEPRLPRWGLLELIVETLGGDTGEFRALWVAAGAGEDQEPPGAIPAAAAPRQLPADVVAFTGRADQLHTLDRLLAESAGTRAVTVAAITGSGGIGKTALAVHWAHRVAARFPDGQLYLNLRGYHPDQPMRAAEALETLLRALGVTAADMPQELSERAASYRTRLAGRRMLILLDNAHSVEQIRDLLPGSPSCLVIVTSRDSLPALVARYGATRVNLDLLAVTEAHSLLRTLIGARVDADPDGAAALAQRCARLPLALRIAAELAVSRPSASLADLVHELGDERRLDLLAAGDDDYTAIRAVFSWSLRNLAEPAALAFPLLGLHPRADLDGRAIVAVTGADPAGARSVIDTLIRAHLLDDLGGGRFGMHDLLHAYAAEQARHLDDADRRAATARLLDHYVNTAGDAVRTGLPTAGPAGLFATAEAALAWLDAEHANLLAMAHAAADGWAAATVALSTTLAPHLDARAHYHDALILHRLARTAAATSGDVAAEARSAAVLGTVLRRLGDYQGALESHRHALALYRQIGDRASEGPTLHGLGLACWRLGRYTEALEHIGQAAALFHDNGERADEGRALYGLGITYFQLGRYAEARDHHTRAITLLQQAGDRTGEGRTLNNIGLISQRLGSLHDAEDHFRRALQIAREVGNRTGAAVALINLGDVGAQLGRFDEARDRYDQGLALSRHVGYRVGQADALRGLGVIAAHTGGSAEAIEHLGHALALCREIGEQETHVRTALDSGDVLRSAGRLDESVNRYRDGLELAVRSADAYGQARAHAALATALVETGDLTAARSHAKHAAAFCIDLGLPETTEIPTSISALANRLGI